MKKNYVIPFLLLAFLFTSKNYGQELEDYLSSYTGKNGKGYVQPLANSFGANINSGLFHNADVSTIGIDVYVGIVTMTAFIPDDDRTFKASTEGFFSPETTVDAPTIFGKETVEIEGVGGTSYSFPGGLDIGRLPLAVPQITVGSFMGTDATLRFMQLDLGDNFGELNLFGLGARHSISQYLPLLPIDIAAGIYYQSFEVGSIVEASALLLSAQASYSLPILTLYGGLGYESSSMDVSYEYGDSENPEKIKFDVDAVNSMRLTLGAAVKLAVLTLHVDYNISSQNVLVLGLGFEF